MTFSISTEALLAQVTQQLEDMLIAAVGAVDSLPDATQQALQAGQTSNQALVLTGTFTGQTASGQSVLQTAAGPVTLNLNAPPPAGTVTVQIQPGANGTAPTATVLIPRQAASAQAQQTETVNQTGAASSPTVVPPPPLLAGSTITGTLLPPLPVFVEATSPEPDQAFVNNNNSNPTPVIPATNAGVPSPPSSIPATSLELASPATATPAQPSSLLAGIDPTLAAQEDLPANAPVSSSQAVPQTSPAQSSSEAFYVVSVVEDSVPASEPAPEFPAVSQTPTPQTASTPAQATIQSSIQGPIQGNVIASTPSGQPILSLPSGTLLVNEAASVKTGATVILLSLGQTTDAAASARSAATPIPLALAGKTVWPALAQLLTALPPEQAEALKAGIPNLVTSQTEAGAKDFVASFVSFVSSGRIELVPIGANGGAPDQIKILQAALGQALNDIAAPAAHTAGQAAAQIFGQWQTYPVPVMTGAELALIQLYVRRQPPTEETEEEDGQGKKKRRRTMTRFLVEVHPQALGPVQLDGLVRKDTIEGERAALPDLKPQLDLIVRTEVPLPPQSESEMGLLFDTAIGATGVTGRLTFQTGRDNFVQPESAAAHAFSRKV